MEVDYIINPTYPEEGELRFSFLRKALACGRGDCSTSCGGVVQYQAVSALTNLVYMRLSVFEPLRL